MSTETKLNIKPEQLTVIEQAAAHATRICANSPIGAMLAPEIFKTLIRAHIRNEDDRRFEEKQRALDNIRRQSAQVSAGYYVAPQSQVNPSERFDQIHMEFERKMGSI